MVKQKIEEPRYEYSALKITREEFCNLLQTQIVKGEELCNREVQRIADATSSYGDFMYISRNRGKVMYDEASKNSYIADFNRWNNYNVEIYKTSFEVPNSTYRRDYEQSVCWTFWGGDIIKEYKDNIAKLINQMKSDIERVELIPCNPKPLINAQPTAVEVKDMHKVFIVHGHDDAAINEVKLFLTKIGLTPIVLREQANGGKTIIEKIEQYTDVAFSIVLYTPCDEGKAKTDVVYKDRARQNVVFEHGYLCAKLGRSNVCALVKGNVEIPGDMSGIVYIAMQKGWEFEVAKELKNAHIEIDANRLL